MFAHKSPPPIELPADLAILPIEWEVRVQGMNIGIISSSGDGSFRAATFRGFSCAGHPTRESAAAALVKEARR